MSRFERREHIYDVCFEDGERGLYWGEGNCWKAFGQIERQRGKLLVPTYRIVTDRLLRGGVLGDRKERVDDKNPVPDGP